MTEAKPVTSQRISVPAGMKSADNSSLSVKEVLGILRRNVIIIFILTSLGFASGFGIWKALQKYSPKYTATTYIKVLSPTPSDPWVIGGVQPQKDILYAHRRSIANLIKQQSTLEDLLERDAVRQTQWFRQNDGNIRNAVRSLNGSLIAFPHRDSDFVQVSMTSANAKESADIVNEMVKMFLAQQKASETSEVSEKLTLFREQRKEIQRQYEAADRELDKIRDDSGILDIEMPESRNFKHTFEVILEQLELEETKLDLAKEKLSTDVEILRNLAEGPISEQIEFMIEQDAVMISLAQQLSLQQASLEGLLTKFGENHPEVVRLRESINQVQKQRELRKRTIAEQTRLANLRNTEDALVALQKSYDKLQELRQEAEEKKDKLDSARVLFEKQRKIRDERHDMLDQIDEQIEKVTSMYNDPEIPKVQAVGEAPPPWEMVFSRQWWLWVPTGTMLGLLLGIAFAFTTEITKDEISTPSEVSKYLQLPLLAVIPDASEDKLARGVDLQQVVRQAPYSLLSESYRRCRANLMLSSPIESLKAILVTSGMVGEGKTSTAVNLAMTIVATGKKVLLIDANFRNPELDTIFPKTQSQSLESLEAQHFNYGLSSVLMRQCKPSQAIRPSGIEKLDIIDCGPLPANPADLLGSLRMEEFLKELRKYYDHIIIDGAPALLVSDSTVLSGLVDATLLVFCADDTNTGAAQRTIREMKNASTNIIGCILFAARSRKGGYFRKQYKSYRKYQKKIKA